VYNDHSADFSRNYIYIYMYMLGESSRAGQRAGEGDREGIFVHHFFQIEIFSKFSSLLNLLCTITVELTFLRNCAGKRAGAGARVYICIHIYI